MCRPWVPGNKGLSVWLICCGNCGSGGIAGGLWVLHGQRCRTHFGQWEHGLQVMCWGVGVGGDVPCKVNEIACLITPTDACVTSHCYAKRAEYNYPFHPLAALPEVVPCSPRTVLCCPLHHTKNWETPHLPPRLSHQGRFMQCLPPSLHSAIMQNIIKWNTSALSHMNKWINSCVLSTVSNKGSNFVLMMFIWKMKLRFVYLHFYISNCCLNI